MLTETTYIAALALVGAALLAAWLLVRARAGRAPALETPPTPAPGVPADHTQAVLVAAALAAYLDVAPAQLCERFTVRSIRRVNAPETSWMAAARTDALS